MDTGGSDWSARCGFEPPAEREPLAQALLAHAVEAAAAAADAQVRCPWRRRVSLDLAGPDPTMI